MELQNFLILCDVIKGRSFTLRYDVRRGQLNQIHEMIDKLGISSFPGPVLLNKDGLLIKNDAHLERIIGQPGIIFVYNKNDIEMSTEELLYNVNEFKNYEHDIRLTTATYLKDDYSGLTDSKMEHCLMVVEVVCKIACYYHKQIKQMFKEYRNQYEGWNAILINYKNSIEKLCRKCDSLLENVDTMNDTRTSDFTTVREATIFVNKLKNRSIFTLSNQTENLNVNEEGRIFHVRHGQKRRRETIDQNNELKCVSHFNGLKRFLCSDDNPDKISHVVRRWTDVEAKLIKEEILSLRRCLEEYRGMLLKPNSYHLTGIDKKLERMEQFSLRSMLLIKRQFQLTENIMNISSEPQEHRNKILNSLVVNLFDNDTKLKTITIQFINEKRLLMLRIFRRMHLLVKEIEVRNSCHSRLREHHNIIRLLPKLIQFIRNSEIQFDVIGKKCKYFVKKTYVLLNRISHVTLGADFFTCS